MTIVKRIKKLCESRNITIAELERRTDLKNSTIYRWDTNKPSIDKIQKVADYFDVSTDYLLGRTDDPSPEKKDSKSQMYFRMNTDGLTEEDKFELEEDLKDFMEMRRKRLMDKNNRK
ncbi:helix-turn-helix domain-containing protein [Listeria aquatica]|uniref:helix-turn-helix domain-containing protein n=1 Tax=Listeria aquatica TaxID=1494960 RepID=UPI003EF7DBAD